MSLPSAKLVQPTVEVALPDLFDQIAGLTSLISVSHWFCVVFEKLSGFDIEKSLGRLVAGDWEKVATLASAVRHLGEYFDEYGNQIDTGRAALFPAGWTGHAADKSDTYFTGYARQVGDLQKPVDDVAAQFRSAATGMKEAGAAVVNILEALIDATEGAAGVLITTVCAIVGLPVGIGEVLAVVDAAEVIVEAMNIVKLTIQLINAIGVMFTFVQTIVGLTAGMLSLIHGLKENLLLPAGAYDHPGV